MSGQRRRDVMTELGELAGQALAGRGGGAGSVLDAVELLARERRTASPVGGGGALWEQSQAIEAGSDTETLSFAIPGGSVSLIQVKATVTSAVTGGTFQAVVTGPPEAPSVPSPLPQTHTLPLRLMVRVPLHPGLG